MTRTKDFYLLLLSWALVEIRALQYEGNLDLAPKVADMLHNVPEALRLPWTVDRDERIYEQIRAKAGIYGLTEMLDGWERAALRRISQEAGEQQNVCSE